VRGSGLPYSFFRKILRRRGFLGPFLFAFITSITMYIKYYYQTHLSSYIIDLSLSGMMNEGLEALAALASTSQSTPAQGDLGPNNSSQRTNENPFSAHGSNEDTPSFTSSGSTAADPMRCQPPLSTSNFIQMPHNGNLSQWQEAPQQDGSGMNPSPLSNNNLALLLGMQQRQPQPQADPLALLQQQLSYYRYNMTSQSGNQMAAGTGDSAVQQTSTTSLEPHQALALSLAFQAHQQAQQNGKSLISMFCLLQRHLRPIAKTTRRLCSSFIVHRHVSGD
jgi:hypothetical protein